MTGTDLAALNVVVAETYLLTAHDRCDQCGSRAYVHTILATNNLDLYWCRHHWLEHRPKLIDKCTYINDETKQLFDGIVDDHWIEGQKAVPPSQRKNP